MAVEQRRWSHWGVVALVSIALGVAACSGGPGSSTSGVASASAPSANGGRSAVPTIAAASAAGSPQPSVAGLPSLPAGPVGPVSLKAGPDLCALLSAADLTAVGIQGAGPVNKNALEAPTNFFCVYAGKSGGTGGIELDVSIIDPKDGDQVTAAVPPFGSEEVTNQVPGADKAIVYVPSPPTTDAAQIGAQAGTIMFELYIPVTDSAKSSLIALARLVVGRVAAASSGALTLPVQPLLPSDLCDWVTASDLAAISSSQLTPAKPVFGGEFGFNDASVGGTYLGKQVTCSYDDANGQIGLRLDVLHEPSDTPLIDKVWGEQVAYYADEAARPGELMSVVTTLSGIGEGAQKVKQSYAAGGAFNDWILEAVKGPVLIRLDADVAGGTQEKSDAALVAILGRILDRAAAAVGG